ncbi:MAG: acyl-CoA/acyl-ACP dehydrogenase [Armatimonadetes bacterium]|nr:acyl-CoA/acyl-ACP dehydrogenase [Armatimonadota bacterium]
MNDVLDRAEKFLSTRVAPNANAIDRDPEELRKALQGMCDEGLMALRRPRTFGGPELPEPEFRTFQESVARRSGSLAFLQTQHQSAGSMIAKGENAALAQEYLPLMADGRKLVGIGFSQLRRPGPPILTAEPHADGFLLSGHVPWVTGWTFYPEFLIGAALPDGSAVFGIVPFVDSPGITFSEPMKLAAMESPLTVTADLAGLTLTDDRVAFVKPPGWIHQNDLINITIQGFFAVGCALAGLDVVWRAYEKKRTDFLRTAHQKLEAEVLACREAMVKAQETSTEDVTTAEKLRVRAWAIELAARCAHAGVAASSGAANSIDHDAQRVYREALVYTVSAQTAPIMEATLERLSRSG